MCSVQAFKDSKALYNRPSAIFEQCFEPLNGSKSIQSVNNDAWKQRKKLLHGLIRGDNLESFFHCFVEIACEKAAAWTPGKPIVLMKEMFQMPLKALLNTSLGNIFEDNNGINELANLYHQCKCEMDERILEAPPPNSQQELDFQKTLKRLMDCLKQMLQTRRNQTDSEKALPLLDALINSGASDDLILSDMVTFLGGFHTSAYYATWLFYFLAEHPYIQEKLYQNIAAKVGDDKGMKLKAYTFTSTSYLRQVLDEGFRKSMTTTFSAHYSDEDIMLDGYCVPAKTPIIHALGVVMNNDAVWEEPDKFNPDRFAPGSPHAKRGPEFRPFRVPHIRRCPANQFMYLMVSVYVTILLRQFILPTEDGHVPERKHGIATSPKDELHIVVEPRQQN